MDKKITFEKEFFVGKVGQFYIEDGESSGDKVTLCKDVLKATKYTEEESKRERISHVSFGGIYKDDVDKFKSIVDGAGGEIRKIRLRIEEGAENE